MIIPYVLFFLAGLGFGYALDGFRAFIPIVFPVLLFLGAIARDGSSGEVFFRLVIAIVLTVVGVVLGRLLAERGESEPAGAG